MFLPLHYNKVRDYLLILDFPISNRTGSHNTGPLYLYQFNPIEKQIEDKDICLRVVYAKVIQP